MSVTNELQGKLRNYREINRGKKPELIVLGVENHYGLMNEQDFMSQRYRDRIGGIGQEYDGYRVLISQEENEISVF